MNRERDRSFSDDENQNQEGPHPKPLHYYGDITRRLFIAAGTIMLIGMPLFSDYVPTIATMSALVVVVIGIVAGIASPRSLAVQILFLAFSALGVAFFELYAMYAYRYLPFEGRGILFFVIMQTLAVLFFFALYFSTKSVRWMSRRSNSETTA